mgnify:CR=1 FL=1
MSPAFFDDEFGVAARLIDGLDQLFRLREGHNLVGVTMDEEKRWLRIRNAMQGRDGFRGRSNLVVVVSADPSDRKSTRLNSSHT